MNIDPDNSDIVYKSALKSTKQEIVGPTVNIEKEI